MLSIFTSEYLYTKLSRWLSNLSPFLWNICFLSENYNWFYHDFNIGFVEMKEVIPSCFKTWCIVDILFILLIRKEIRMCQWLIEWFFNECSAIDISSLFLLELNSSERNAHLFPLLIPPNILVNAFNVSPVKNDWASTESSRESIVLNDKMNCLNALLVPIGDSTI